MMVFIALGAALVIFWFSVKDWRRTVKTALILVILEGVIRKWILPQSSDLIYFLKDFVLLGAYFQYFLSSESKYPFKNNILTIFLLFSLSWGIVQIFNPSLGSPIIGLFGLKAYFYYIPLMWMLPSLFQSKEELISFLRFYLLLAIPVCLLAVVQFFSPASSPINVYAGGEESIATFAGIDAPRVTGTFSYLAGYSTYLSICFTLLVPLLALPQPKIWQLLALTEALLVVSTSFMTGARGLLFFEVMFVVGYVIFLTLFHSSAIIASAQKLVLPVFIILAVVPRFFGRAVDAFSSRTESSESQAEFSNRIFAFFSEPRQAAQFKGGLDSFGIGATHQATNALRQVLDLPFGEMLPPSEDEPGRIVLEVGLLGFVFWYGLRIILIFKLWQVFLKLKTPFLRQLTLATLLFQTINLPIHLVFNHTFSTYYWFFSGFIFLLPEIEYRQSWFKHTIPSSSVSEQSG